jgi:hypothetical protein
MAPLSANGTHRPARLDAADEGGHPFRVRHHAVEIAGGLADDVGVRLAPRVVSENGPHLRAKGKPRTVFVAQIRGHHHRSIPHFTPEPLRGTAQGRPAGAGQDAALAPVTAPTSRDDAPPVQDWQEGSRVVIPELMIGSARVVAEQLSEGVNVEEIGVDYVAADGYGSEHGKVTLRPHGWDVSDGSDCRCAPTCDSRSVGRFTDGDDVGNSIGGTGHVR